MKQQIIKHDGRLYAISESEKTGEFIVIKAKPLPQNQKLVEQIKIIKADNLNHVKRIIRSGEIDNLPSPEASK